VKEEFNYGEYTLIYPSVTSWFNLEKIHEIEMAQLPEYFNNKFPYKTPSSYINQRNSIIKMYRESPNAYLSASLCRKHILSDACSVIRMHAFLEHWGIINFNVDPFLKPPQDILKGDNKEVLSLV
jgi:hypothetical protein